MKPIIALITLVSCCSSQCVRGFGFVGPVTVTSSRKISQGEGKLYAIPSPIVMDPTMSIVREQQNVNSEFNNDIYIQSDSKSIVSSSLLTSFRAGNLALDSAFGRVANDDSINIPIRNINAEGDAIDNFYGLELTQPWGSNDAVTPATNVDYVKANPELLKEYAIERNMLNLLPIVGVVWGAAYFAMNWINYEVNDQTYMSEEEEAQVLTAQVPLVFGLMGLTFLVALWSS